jgi:hypothetical protein
VDFAHRVVQTVWEEEMEKRQHGVSARVACM